MLLRVRQPEDKSSARESQDQVGVPLSPVAHTSSRINRANLHHITLKFYQI